MGPLLVGRCMLLATKFFHTSFFLHYRPGEAVETPPENRRRSARLNSKGRTSTDGGDEETEPKQPVVKRSRKSRENGKDETDGEF